MANFRPISLCMVLYKIIAKTISNRLQAIIGKIIDKAQFFFIPDRLISNNILIAYEILHKLRQKRSGRKGFMALKLDMSKVFDRVEWGFLEVLIRHMGFDKTWTDIIIRCISTVSL